MKTNILPLQPAGTARLRRGKSAFTLMELLVVITIIGILATMMMPAGHQIMKRMRITQATKTAAELRTAIMNYYSEYKRFPAFDTSSSGVSDHFGDTLIETNGEAGLIATLLAVPDDPFAEKYNRRNISFFTAKPAKQKGMSGVWKEGENYQLYDPWKNHFWVLYDSNMNNTIKAPSRSDGADEDMITDVAVWSYGPDGLKGGEEGRRNDDVYSY